MTIIEKIQSLPLPVLNHWGYWIILAASLSEASPGFGILIPGQTIVILGGFFVKMGALDMGGVILVSAVGAIVGDLTGYVLGRKYGYSFIAKYGKYFFFKEDRFETVKNLIQNHAGKTLVFGRFNSFTRAFAPFAAGSSNVPLGQFLIYNFIGGISWAVTFVLMGYVFGKSYEVASRYLGKFIFIAVVLGLLFIFLYRFINKRKHIFTRYHLYMLVFNLFSLYLFAKMIEDVTDQEWITRVDVWVNAKMVLLWNPLLNKLMVTITTIANPVRLLIASIVLLGVLVLKKKWYYSWLLFFSMTGGLLFELLVKLIIHRARPENALIAVSGYSFPSGHATMSLIFFSMVLYAFKNDIRNKALRGVFIAANIILFVLIGSSRVYLDVHWLSDVIAGFSLGLFWLTLMILIFKVVVAVSRRTDISFGRIKSHLKKYIVLAGHLRADQRVPRLSKILFALAMGYFFLPFDLIPDFIPVIGHLDDLVIVPGLILLALMFIPREVYEDNYKSVFGDK